MHNHDLLADLPAPHDDEPPSLRSDIVDELADHLHCAFRREVLKDGDETAAEERVLDRFGDPKQLARRLWWQAMWSRIMGKRILAGLQWVLTLAALVMAGAVFWQQSQILTEMSAARQAETSWYQNLSTQLNDLRNRLPTPLTSTGQEEIPGGAGAAGGGTAGLSITPEMMLYNPSSTVEPPPSFGAGMRMGAVDATPPHTSGPGTVLLYLTQQSSSRDLAASSVKLVGREMIGPTRISEPPRAENGNIVGALFEFEHLPVDRYELQIKLPDGQRTKQPVVVRDSKLRRIELDCPAPRENVPVVITAPPLPDDLREAGWRLSYNLSEEPKSSTLLGWTSDESSSYTLIFDPATGQLNSIQGPAYIEGMGGVQYKIADVSQADPQDRAIFLRTGPVSARFRLVHHRGAGGRGGLQAVSYPPTDDHGQQWTVEPGENRWELELPEDMLAAARKQLAGASPVLAPGEPPGADGLPGDNPPGDSPGAKTATDDKPDNDNAAVTTIGGEHSRLIVKLTSQSRDGPVVDVATLKLLNQKNESVKEGKIRGGLQDTGGPIKVREPDGLCILDGIEPGRYRLQLEIPGWMMQQNLPLLRNGQQRTVHIVCPPPAIKTNVLITASPVPEDLRRQAVTLGAALMPVNQTLDDREWGNGRIKSHKLFFDESTGQLKAADDTDLSQEPPEDRLIFVSSGPYKIHLVLRQLRPGLDGAREIAQWDLPVNDESPYVAKPGENVWNIKVPDEFWADARKKLTAVLAPGESPGADGLPGDNPPGDSPAAKTPTAQSRITILAHARGEPLRDVQVTLFGYKEDKPSGSTQPAELASVTTDDSGTAEFDELMAGDYQLILQSPQYGMRTYLGFELSGADHQGRTVAVPTDVAATELNILAANLPDDLIQANVRLGIRLTPEALKRDDQPWFANHDPYTAWVIGPRGIEGQLQLPKKVGGKAFHDAFFTQRHPYQPVTESTLKIMSTAMHSSEWGLVCPAPTDGPTDAEQPAVAEWMVCASPPEKKGPGRSEPVPMMLNFQPAIDQPNVWRIEIPEGMIAQARAKIRAAKGK